MSQTRPHFHPGPDHPITVEPAGQQVSVKVGDTVVAETSRALRLQEANYPAVFYIHPDDVNRDVLRASDEHTYCPYKGEASYYDIVTPEGELPGAVWYYPQPYNAVAEIKDHVAFYTDRVTLSASPLA
jgi:uncharacterized protein (DUF427 family)